MPGTGLEPVRVAARDFKSLASAYSATPANKQGSLFFIAIKDKLLYEPLNG